MLAADRGLLERNCAQSVLPRKQLTRFTPEWGTPESAISGDLKLAALPTVQCRPLARELLRQAVNRAQTKDEIAAVDRNDLTARQTVP